MARWKGTVSDAVRRVGLRSVGGIDFLVGCLISFIYETEVTAALLEYFYKHEYFHESLTLGSSLNRSITN